MINVLSFDIEEWFHLLNVPHLSHPGQWASLPQIVEPYTYHILEILSRFKIRATFFVVGCIAERYPKLVQEIAAAGHEVASHSYWHHPVNRLNQQEFAEDLRRSVDTLRQITGQEVMGFRAPGFSLTTQVDWAFDVLLDQGLKYDASLVPYRVDRFNCPAEPHLFEKTPSGRSIMELPVSALPLGRFSVPYCGGGYLRLMPQPLLNLLMKLQNSLNLPNVVYLHPRDFALDCPRTPLSPLRAFRTYHGIASTQLKLESMLRQFQWDCCAAVFGLFSSDTAVAQAMPQLA